MRLNKIRDKLETHTARLSNVCQMRLVLGARDLHQESSIGDSPSVTVGAAGRPLAWRRSQGPGRCSIRR
ncbi:MAG: hypothetical protein E5299_01712 [Burkholderia gladioli]|nr:MAG: hypothetical protein E5299_01712 [Burkholderia gladioli]